MFSHSTAVPYKQNVQAIMVEALLELLAKQSKKACKKAQYN